MWFLLLFLLITSPVSATEYISSSSVSISGSIGKNEVTITGYTSPKSRVELSSPRVFAVTYSNDTGYFVFDKTLLPQNPSDLCLISIDDNQRQNTPTCIPSPPQTNYHTDIGPILLPPTISLENDTINPNSTIITSGQSIPNSQISVHFYKVDDNAKSFLSFLSPKPVQAYSLPNLSVVSDALGNFSLNIPTAYASDYRLYASTKFKDNYSPKSNTLVYILPSLFWLFIQQNIYLIYFLPIYLLTIAIFFYLIKISRHQKIHYFPSLRQVSLVIT